MSILSFITKLFCSGSATQTTPQPRWKDISFSKIQEGDTIRVNVGFDSHKTEGNVRRKITGEDNYVWCDVISSSGKYIRSFTASASYGRFEKLIS